MLSLFALLTAVPCALAALELHPNASSSAYPFAIHLPLNRASSSSSANSSNGTALPPVLLSLHGSGSKGTPDELANKARWDSIGWLISQYDGGNQTGAQQVVAEEYFEEWDPESVLSVLSAVKELAASNSSYAFDETRVALVGYSIASLGSYGAWQTAFHVGYPTPFASLVPYGGSSGFSDSSLSIIANPRSELDVSTLSVYGAGGAVDEKQPAVETVETIRRLEEQALTVDDEKADSTSTPTEGNWTAVVIEGANHKLMSQDAWFEMGLWTWLAEQQQQQQPKQGNDSSTLGTNATGGAEGGLVKGQTSGAARTRPVGFGWILSW
ncbi:hypothetical protein JCM10212_002189 [Sporobolomyces blumeae]